MSNKKTSHSYFVVMIDYGNRGREAIVDPEMTRRDVVARIASGEYAYDLIAFIHHIHDGVCEDVTEELIAAIDDDAALQAAE